MDNLNLLCQTIRFQRTALQNSLAMISAVQQHGQKLLKTTLEQSPWIPGEGRDACLFWAGLWTKNLTGMTDLVDKNLATMERLTSAGEKREAAKRKPEEKPATGPPQPPEVARKATPEKKLSAEKPQSEEKKPQTEEKEITPPKPAEQTAMVKTDTQKAPVSDPPPEKKPEQPPGKPSEKKKTSEPKT